MYQQEKEKGGFVVTKKQQIPLPIHQKGLANLVTLSHYICIDLEKVSATFHILTKRGIKHKKCQLKKNILIVLPGGVRVVKKPIYLVTLCRSFCKNLQDQNHHKRWSKDNNIMKRIVLPGSVGVLVLDKVDAELVRLVVDVLQLLQDGVTLHALLVIWKTNSR
jgi:hypothetical protein